MQTRSFTNLGFEEKLFKAADKLRKNMDASEYKHVVLGLIFLKFVSDAFEHRKQQLKQELEAETSDLYGNEEAIKRTLEDRDEYAGENIFWVPQPSRWQHLQENATQPQIGKLIDDALYQLEIENPSLKGVFTRNYSRPALESRTLTELINLFSDIDFTPHRESPEYETATSHPTGKGFEADGSPRTNPPSSGGRCNRAVLDRVFHEACLTSGKFGRLD